jgi:murein DD-endopeptidase MepM/ murein hydrolase activator NlpD
MRRWSVSFAPLVIVPLAWMQGAAKPREEREHTLVRETVATNTCEGTPYGTRCLSAPRCAQGEVDLDGICLPFSNGEERRSQLETNAHVDRSGRRVVYDHLPRRPELPADYDRYTYPVLRHGARAVSSGYDLSARDEDQRRNERLSAVGHGGVDLPQVRGAPVRVVALRGEVGEPEVVHVGAIFGTTVVLRHVVREANGLQTYLALHGHLSAAAPDLRRGMTVAPGTTIGFVGDSGSIGVVHLHYEVRLMRPGVDPMRVESGFRLVDQEVSVPCDPRNVLPYQ